MSQVRTMALVLEPFVRPGFPVVDVLSMRKQAPMVRSSTEEQLAGFERFLDELDDWLEAAGGRLRLTLTLSGMTAEVLRSHGLGPRLRKMQASGCLEIAGGTYSRTHLDDLAPPEVEAQLVLARRQIGELVGESELAFFGEVGCLQDATSLKLVGREYGCVLHRSAVSEPGRLVRDDKTGVLGLAVDPWLSDRIADLLAGKAITGQVAQEIRSCCDVAEPVIHLPIADFGVAIDRLHMLIYALLADPKMRLLRVGELSRRLEHEEKGSLLAELAPQNLSGLQYAARQQILRLAPLVGTEHAAPATALWRALLARACYEPDPQAPPKHVCGSVAHDHYVELSTLTAAVEMRLRAEARFRDYQEGEGCNK